MRMWLSELRTLGPQELSLRVVLDHLCDVSAAFESFALESFCSQMSQFQACRNLHNLCPSSGVASPPDCN